MPQRRFELFQLRCFTAVAEELSFRRAAERLNITQPPLSRQIKLLEENINLKLLDRNNRRVKLTAAGENFYRSSIELLKNAEKAVLDARQAEHGNIGNVTLGFVPSAALQFVPLIAKNVSLELPNVNFVPVEMMGYEIIEACRSAWIDLGLTRMERPRGEIERTLVVSEPFVAAIPSSHRLAGVSELSMSDFEGQPYVSYTTDRGGFLKETVLALFSSCGVVPETKIEASQTHAVISMVNQGVGFAIVPSSAQVMAMKNITFRELNLPSQFRSDMYLITGIGKTSLLRGRVEEIIVETLSPFREPTLG